MLIRDHFVQFLVFPRKFKILTFFIVAGSPGGHEGGFLEDGLGAKRLCHCHDHQPNGKRKGECFSSF